MKIIDSHLHFFDLSQGDYHWLQPNNPPFWPDKSVINRDFSLTDLILAPKDQLLGVVHIEAGFNNQQPWREISWLEQSNKRLPVPLRTIASVDLTESVAKFRANLNHLAQFSSWVGVRHILDQAASDLLNKPVVKKNLNQLATQSLIFEAQLNGKDIAGMQALFNIANQLPQLQIVISHAGFPPNEPQALQTWQQQIKAIAQCRNVVIKASGWEMVNRDYQMSQLTARLSDLIQYFGINRVMLASNFPLCLFSHSYQNLWQHYQQAMNQLGLSPTQQSALSATNSHNIYKF